MTTDFVFDDLKKFGDEVLLSKARIEQEKQAKEKASWETVLKDFSANMKLAQKYGSDHFNVCVDLLTEEQRKELVEKITETDKRLTATVRRHTLRDSSERDYIEVKISL